MEGIGLEEVGVAAECLALREVRRETRKGIARWWWAGEAQGVGWCWLYAVMGGRLEGAKRGLC